MLGTCLGQLTLSIQPSTFHRVPVCHPRAESPVPRQACPISDFLYPTLVGLPARRLTFTLCTDGNELPVSSTIARVSQETPAHFKASLSPRLSSKATLRRRTAQIVCMRGLLRATGACATRRGRTLLLNGQLVTPKGRQGRRGLSRRWIPCPVQRQVSDYFSLFAGQGRLV
ncbi:uncharacterized protein LY79DRAFT_145209 [Colletotrichum navitas]|uniref:Uncharacterized protein n=1 Tax=Colletotrichum navitas TaxID=681940 RepID=A0AAD8QCQ7_9PEZI|nr:uncharacterized protein LY79DRAFT_145209 [Colletotrichum navitas]KAK1599591.1 hypothetical protein LY79DRAFT_145209 [Colletotrichum navitas]